MQRVTAVMVDLGWPWWVSTVFAGSVAVVCAAIFLRDRRPVVRGVAGILGVQGVAMAIAAPFLMPGSSGGTMSPAPAAAMMPAGVRAAGLSRAGFARRADGNCRRFGREAGALGTATALPRLARELDRMTPLWWRAYGAQGLLAPPRSENETAYDWMNVMAAMGHDLETARAAARRGDAAGVRAAQARTANHDNQLAQLSMQLGMKLCR